MASRVLASWHGLSAKQTDGGAMGQATLVGSYRGGSNWRHTSPVPIEVPVPLRAASRGRILPAGERPRLSRWSCEETDPPGRAACRGPNPTKTALKPPANGPQSRFLVGFFGDVPTSYHAPARANV